jgi:hypothetical protein
MPLAWYWHRLRAMDAAEIVGRIKKESLQIVDARRSRDWTSIPLKPGQTWPRLPNPQDVPEPMRDALRRDTEEILAGKWRAFGHVPIRVSDPPQWHKDYLAEVDLPTNESAFKLDHRSLPKGADIKLIWELSRWHQLTRLALAAYVLDNPGAARKCIHWLEHWAQHNPPYRGWNWTSALESGLRLIQFTWIDALLQPFVIKEQCDAEFDQLRYEILPAHVWFTWRHKSFGSSANNHLMGELAGLILATVRWPELAQWATPLAQLQGLWEREVLAQFAEDGGNREQALNYHLFSFELCWHTANALSSVQRRISPSVLDRLQLAANFFSEVQVPCDQWDYGDSDSAFVVPLAADTSQTTREWLEWTQREPTSLATFIGEAPKPRTQIETLPGGWRVFRKSGIAINQINECFLRWDVSPLGYLPTAAHGHLDALHLSLWLRGVAMIIDPGTGAYYANSSLRNWLASRRAHNGPYPEGAEWPRRLGPFLWSENHRPPTIESAKRRVTAELTTPTVILKRSIEVSEQAEIVVEDSMRPVTNVQSFSVLWQFAPGAECAMIAPGKFRLTRSAAVLDIQISADWQTVELVQNPSPGAGISEGTVSPAFRATPWAPYLKLTAKTGHKPCLFTTTFLASRTP